MTKQTILEYFKDINEMYNNCNMLDLLSNSLDELTARDTPVDAVSVGSDWEYECPTCHSPVYDGQKYCFECGQAVKIQEVKI